MSISVRNIVSGEVVKVSNTDVRDGQIVGRYQFGTRYFNKYGRMLTKVSDTEDGQRPILALSEGWEIINMKSEPKQPKQAEPAVVVETAPTEAEQPTAEAEPVVKEEQPAAEAEAVPTEATPAEETEDETSTEQALIAAIKNLRGGAVDITKVREIVKEEFQKLCEDDPKRAAKVLKVIRKQGKKEVYCDKFERIVAKVSRGNNVYLHGPAGSGKSHTGEQVAERLGLKFYGQTTIQFTHDVRGYGDAGGNFQETPFFKAFSQGGLYFQDEYDRSNAEAAIVLNSALANGWYDFPVIGRVEAHPDFRFMAAGNTLMTGPDEEYITGQEIDPSSRDRFASFFRVDYSHEVEMSIAHGNAEVVAFVEDVRKAVKEAGLKHVVSYRATAAMTDEIEHENDLVACCDESVFKGLDDDARREIYERLEDKQSAWAKALKKLI